MGAVALDHQEPSVCVYLLYIQRIYQSFVANHVAVRARGLWANLAVLRKRCRRHESKGSLIEEQEVLNGHPTPVWSEQYAVVEGEDVEGIDVEGKDIEGIDAGPRACLRLFQTTLCRVFFLISMTLVVVEVANSPSPTQCSFSDPPGYVDLRLESETWVRSSCYTAPTAGTVFKLGGTENEAPNSIGPSLCFASSPLTERFYVIGFLDYTIHSNIMSDTVKCANVQANGGSCSYPACNCAEPPKSK
ncbi:predicted protein [Postia placenta Mad-698-R]|nr:predicted protein [Postia placenta Mad-698-R]